tara:strand:+ start:410 stop:1021 length:612 start_codon:yes stop_codon:yes gene_type:complete
MESKMNKKLVVVPLMLTAFLGACSTQNSFEKRAERQMELKQERVESALDEAPDWMTEPPKNSNSVVYASGTASSGDFNMAMGVARTNAFEGICMAAGGAVKSQTKVYRNDSDRSTTSLNTTAIKSICPSVDITGAEVVESKVVAEYGRYRAYILAALPIGEANVLKTTKVGDHLSKLSITSRSAEFKELDEESKRLENRAPVR